MKEKIVEELLSMEDLNMSKYQNASKNESIYEQSLLTTILLQIVLNYCRKD